MADEPGMTNINAELPIWIADVAEMKTPAGRNLRGAVWPVIGTGCGNRTRAYGFGDRRATTTLNRIC